MHAAVYCTVACFPSPVQVASFSNFALLFGFSPATLLTMSNVRFCCPRGLQSFNSCRGTRATRRLWAAVCTVFLFGVCNDGAVWSGPGNAGNGPPKVVEVGFSRFGPSFFAEAAVESSAVLEGGDEKHMLTKKRIRALVRSGSANDKFEFDVDEREPPVLELDLSEQKRVGHSAKSTVLLQIFLTAAAIAIAAPTTWASFRRTPLAM
eukprot:GHVT01078536.1.p1 GENE.GHVT01078536.1~~GHVT01078536.1.p1  ORF type:complete len:207 (+),score=16.71 GHVT01078536.1:840-1460(+)